MGAEAVPVVPDLVDPGRWLCHYTSASTAFDHILPTSRLRLGSYETMRDPFESGHPNLWVPQGGLFDSHENWSLYAQTRNEIGFTRARYRLLSLTQGDSTPSASEELPFRCPWGRARLWEQYADAHAGVCLVFERDRLLTALRTGLGGDYWEGAVSYSVRGISGSTGVQIDLDELRADPIEGARRHIEAHHRDLFFLKTDDWATEFEYRVVSTLDTDRAEWPAPPLFLPYGDSLRYVLINGQKHDFTTIHERRAYVASLGAECISVDWGGGRPYPSVWGN